MLMGIKKLNILFWDYNKLENVLGYLHVLTFQDTEYAHLFNTSIEDFASLVTKRRRSLKVPAIKFAKGLLWV